MTKNIPGKGPGLAQDTPNAFGDLEQRGAADRSPLSTEDQVRERCCVQHEMQHGQIPPVKRPQRKNSKRSSSPAGAVTTANSGKNSDRADHLKSYQFKPGQSGNPNGRPRGTREFAALIACETRNGEEMLERLLAIMRDPANEHHLKAIEALMDRMLGRAPQTLELAGGANAFPNGVIILPAKEPVTFDVPTIDNHSRPAAALPPGRSTEEDIHRAAPTVTNSSETRCAMKPQHH